MANFYRGNELNNELEKLIKDADNFLYLVSPFIKFHKRIRDELQLKINRPEVKIFILFGKNEEQLTKSVDSSDIEFLQTFPNITIAYEKELHAKYYASEDRALITSLNLHSYSQNNNIEVGVMLQPQSVLNKISQNLTSNSTLAGDGAYESAKEYFEEVFSRSNILFKKEAFFESQLLGLKRKYSGSKEIVNDFKQLYTPNPTDYSRPKYNYIQEPKVGYCIRSGVQIPYNPKKPFAYEAYQTWAQFGNYDYPENYCHKTGRPSNGKTSMNNPILQY